MIEEVAERYADGFHSKEELARLARERLAARARRGVQPVGRTCAVCGIDISDRHPGATTCSHAHRTALYRRRRV